MRSCLLGYRLRAEAKVSLSVRSPRIVEASVKSEKLQREVRLEGAADALAVACSCAPTELDAPTCKHVWATLLEVDRLGELAEARAASGKLLLAPLAALPPPAAKPTKGPKKATSKPEPEPEPEPEPARLSKTSKGGKGAKASKPAKASHASTTAEASTTRASKKPKR